MGTDALTATLAAADTARANLAPADLTVVVNATIFGSTIDKMFRGLEQLDVGQVLALSTNDP